MEEIYFLRVDEYLNKMHFQKLLSFIPDQKKKELKELKWDIDKKLKLYSEILVRILICKKVHIRNFQIELKRSEYGKPYLSGYNNFYFNVSHTRNAIVVVVSDKEVGIDIEKIGEVDFKIVNRFFSTNEKRYVVDDSTYINKHFFEIWTQKEAYLKYIGKGLSIPLKSFDVTDKKISERIYNFEIENYIISICSEYVNSTYNIRKLNEKNIGEIAEKNLESLFC